jgi:hypothetical protein
MKPGFPVLGQLFPDHCQALDETTQNAEECRSTKYTTCCVLLRTECNLHNKCASVMVWALCYITEALYSPRPGAPLKLTKKAWTSRTVGRSLYFVQCK